MESAIRVVSIMEATFVTGPVKNLLEFARRSREGDDGLPSIRFSVLTYERGEEAAENKFVTASREAGILVDLVKERRRFDLAVIPQIKRIIAERKPDIIQTHNVKSHFLMRVSGLWRTYPWLAFHHGYVTTDFKMRCYNQLDRWSLRAPHHILAVCGAFARDLERRGIARDRITVQHNSVKPFPPVNQASGGSRPRVGAGAGRRADSAYGGTALPRERPRQPFACARFSPAGAEGRPVPSGDRRRRPRAGQDRGGAEPVGVGRSCYPRWFTARCAAVLRLLGHRGRWHRIRRVRRTLFSRR